MRCQRRRTNATLSVALIAVALALQIMLPTGSIADEAGDLFRGKQIRLIVGHPAGGDYDIGGRMLAKYLTRHLSGRPAILVQNMPAAGSIAAANYLYKVAPADGTVFGSFSRNIPSQAVLGLPGLEADPRKFQWLGATSLPGRVCVVRSASTVRTASDIFSREILMAGSGPGSSLSIIPSVINSALGAKFKIVEGYVGAVDGMLAVERGEVDGICNTYSAIKASGDHISSGRVRILFRAEEAALPEAPDAPSIMDFAKKDEQAQLMRFIFSSVEFGRPYVMPPGTPATIVASMRRAFSDATSDPDLIAEISKIDLDMTFRPAGSLMSLIEKLYVTPPQLLDEVRRLSSSGR